MATLGTGRNPIREANNAAATSTSLTGTANTTTTLVGPFKPNLSRDTWVTMVGNTATGSATVLRSRDGGVTMQGLTIGGTDAWGAYTFSGSSNTIVNEAVFNESSAKATYYVSFSISAGTVSYAIDQ